MTTFFTSDTHFGHARIIELSGRPFSSVEEMNETMVERWNAVVGTSDIVYHLGDAVMGLFEDNVKYLGQLNGTKFLVPGNHDRVSSVERPSRRERFRHFYEDNGFTILDEQFTLSVGSEAFDVSHYPFEGDSHDEDRHAALRPVRQGRRLLHGHVHEKWKVKDDQFNVGVDVNDFTPIHEDVIKAWMS